MWCAEKFGNAAPAMVMVFFAAVPSLAVLAIAEPQSTHVELLPAVRRVYADVRGAFRSRRVLIAMLLLVSPVGPGSAANLFPAISAEYRASSEATIVLTGFAGSFLTVLGCLAGGVIANRGNRWRGFLSAGLAIGVA